MDHTDVSTKATYKRALSSVKFLRSKFCSNISVCIHRNLIMENTIPGLAASRNGIFSVPIDHAVLSPLSNGCCSVRVASKRVSTGSNGNDSVHVANGDGESNPALRRTFLLTTAARCKTNFLLTVAGCGINHRHLQVAALLQTDETAVADDDMVQQLNTYNLTCFG